MPKGPILSRTAYFTQIRGAGSTALIKHHEYNTVDTELGTCVEPRSFAPSLGGDPSGHVVQLDLTDNAFNAVRIIDEGEFQNSFGTGGQGLVDYNA